MLRLATDARLGRLAAAGSEAAIAAIFERHHQALHRYCYSILGNGHDAADALQNTMVKALRSLPGETREIALKPWLYRVAYNESISLLRARRADADLDAAASVGDHAAASLVESREQLRGLTADLAELTERQRGALLMRELGGLEFAEVAEALGTTPSAVKQSVYEARCALQAMEEGRAMGCEDIRRALSDGDRRVLRGARMRGHLRGCSGCRDFELALRARPAQLTAMIPPLPIAAAAAMLHGGLGIGGGSTGGGLAAGFAGGAKATTGLALGTKAAAVVAVSATLGGGAVYVGPAVRDAVSTKPAARQTLPAATPAASRSSATATPTSSAAAATAPAAHQAARDSAQHGPVAAKTGTPSTTPGGKPSTPASGRPATTPGRKVTPARAGKPASAPVRERTTKPTRRKPATVPGRRPVASRVTPAASRAPATVPPNAAATPPAAASGPPVSAGAVPGSAPAAGAAAGRR